MKTLRLLFIVWASLRSEEVLPAGANPGLAVGWGQNSGGEATSVPSSEGTSSSTETISVGGSTLSNLVDLSAGSGHSLALRSDGTVFGWGNNLSGEVTGYKSDYAHSRTNGQVKVAGRILRDIVAISAGGGFSLALRNDGTVVAWGEGLAEKEQSQTIVPLVLSNVVAIAAGGDFSLALKADGSVVGWGLLKVPAGLSNIVAIAAGHDHFSPGLALRKDGVVIQWSPGVDFEGGRVVASNAVAVSAGAGHCLALQRDGTVFGWGSNGGGEATGGPTTTGSYTSSGLVKISGEVLTNVTAVAAGSGFSLALKRDGTVVAWGSSPWHATDVPPHLSGVVAIAAGGGFCLAITTNFPALPSK